MSLPHSHLPDGSGDQVHEQSSRPVYYIVKDRPVKGKRQRLARWAGTRSAGPYNETCEYTGCGNRHSIGLYCAYYAVYTLEIIT